MADDSPRFGKALPIAVAVVGLVLILVLQLLPNRHSIEDDLTERSTRALAAAGMSGVDVRFIGRDGTVRVRSEDDGRIASGIVEAVEGVRVVRVEVLTTLSPTPSPPGPTPTPTPSTPTEVQEDLRDIPPVTFENASATLTAQGQAAVDEAATILKANPTVRVRIEGHTDTNGTAERNLLLSRARAQTVVTALLAQGIAADRMTSAGFGESRLKVPDTSPANQAINRRVEFIVLP